ncbi:hypothetical protein [Nocardia yunnanensis]|nr:hypothetical protein [Nocardia yunnanensis]
MHALSAIVAAGTAMTALGTLTLGFMAGDTTDPIDEGEAHA